jgi:hypothetical protein
MFLKKPAQLHMEAQVTELETFLSFVATVLLLSVSTQKVVTRRTERYWHCVWMIKTQQSIVALLPGLM